MTYEPDPQTLISRIDYTIASIKDQSESMPEELQLLADETVAKLSELNNAISVNIIEIELQKIDEKTKTLKARLKSILEGQ